LPLFIEFSRLSIRLLRSQFFFTFSLIFIVESIVLVILFKSGRVVHWGTMLQAGRSRIRFPVRLLNFFNRPNPSSRTIVLESTQLLLEMSSRNLPGGKEWPARKVDDFYGHLWAECLENVGVSTSHNPMGPHALLQGGLYFCFIQNFVKCIGKMANISNVTPPSLT
jgi:hypothetical protein